jgi:8-oxo-dGTP pyrophosphatase MutT (NUDIX family)
MGLGCGEAVARLTRHAPLGRRAGTRVSPRRGDDDLGPGMLSPVDRSQDAAVLVALLERERDVHILLTRRSPHLSDHAGQIAFPGGRIEAWDASPEAAALREAEEEVGLAPRAVDIVAQLDTYVTRTGYRVTPVVGVVEPPVAFRPDDYEVAEVFEVPLSFLRQPDARRMDSHVFDGRERFFYAFPYGRHYIWGATAGMLVNLLEVLDQPC